MFGSLLTLKMLKTKKRYVLNTNGVNNPGFRLLSEGVDQSNYVNNPVMLWMHFRPTGETQDEVLAIGRIEDIEIDAGGQMTGQPYFDDTDPFAVKIFNKYENGTYNMFSICAVPLEVSVDPADMLPGQTGPTITKSLLKEFSAVDIGGNPDAYGVQLVDEQNQPIKLSDLSINKISNMKLSTINAVGLLPLIKLSDEVTEAQVISKVTEIVQLAEQQGKDLVQLRDEKKVSDDKVIELQSKLDTLETEGKKAKSIALADKAVADRKITPAQKDIYVKLADKDYENTEALLNSMPANPSIKDTISQGDGAKSELVQLSEMSFDDLHKQNKLVRLKELAPETFKAKFKERYGKEPKM